MTAKTKPRLPDLRVLCAIQGMNMAQLARYLDVPVDQVYVWKHRGVPVSRLKEVCRALRCRPEELRPDILSVEG